MRRLENKFDFLASAFQKFCARFDENAPLKPSTKGKGRGKTSKAKNQTNLEAEINAAAEKRLRQFLAENNVVTSPVNNDSEVQSVRRSEISNSRRSVTNQEHRNEHIPSTSRASVNEDMWTGDQSTTSTSRVTATTKTVYLRKVECQINQTPIDQEIINLN